jgi:GT2 family glycosyltransferase
MEQAFDRLRSGDRRGFIEALDKGLAGVSPDMESLSAAETLIRNPAVAEMYYLYNHREYAALLEKADSHRDEPLVASMATAALLDLGDYKGLGGWLEHIDGSLEAVLKYNTAMVLSRGARSGPRPRVHALMLVHEREEHVADAIRAVAGGDCENMALYVADNASSDGGYRAAEKALAEVEGRLETHLERLPTNVGRPAGHNWLIEKHGHSEADYIAIVDDDLTRLPPDWAPRLMDAAVLYPRTAAVGLKAVDPGLPRRVQGSGMRLAAFEEGRVVYTSGAGILDYGQYDYLDRVDHVIGCVNLYDRRALEDVGLFDIRFSPCQFVDVEHHLRARLKGYEIVYHGMLEAGHLRAMGAESLESRQRLSNSKGNLIKLTIKHDPEEVTEFMRRERERYKNWVEKLLEG